MWPGALTGVCPPGADGRACKGRDLRSQVDVATLRRGSSAQCGLNHLVLIFFGGGDQKSGFVVPTGEVLFPLFLVILFLFGESLKKRATNCETYLLGGLEMVSNKN